MELDSLEPDLLWRYYQSGYHCLIRSGLYFRQVLRPALSHVYFQRAVPLLVEYSKANRDRGDLPPGFGDQLEACPLTPRDLLHLDYAICLGFAVEQSFVPDPTPTSPMMNWPGPNGANGLFLAVDAVTRQQEAAQDDFLDDDDEDDGERKPPFDL